LWHAVTASLATARLAARKVTRPGVTRHEVFRVVQLACRHRHDDLTPDDWISGDADTATIEQELIVAEHNAALSGTWSTCPVLRPHALYAAHGAWG
jgi:hypothetical protein